MTYPINKQTEFIGRNFSTVSYLCRLFCYLEYKRMCSESLRSKVLSSLT